MKDTSVAEISDFRLGVKSALNSELLSIRGGNFDLLRYSWHFSEIDRESFVSCEAEGLRAFTLLELEW